MSSSVLAQATQKMLKERPRGLTYHKIEAEVPDLHWRWLSDFANGKINDPRISKVEKLYEYLNGGPLIIV